jgi:triacylglycerol lipase
MSTDAAQSDQQEWVNNNDIVTRVPPAWLGYRHAGREMYIDYKGRARDIEGRRRVLDRLRGFARSLRRFKIDHFSDHSIEDYIDHIHAAVQKQQQAMTQSVPSRRRGPTAVR